MKLSEDIEWCMAGQALNPITASRWMTEARALEERVAELEATSRAKGVGIKAFSSQLAAAIARADAAEAEVARLKAQLPAERDLFMEGLALIKERDALRAKLKKLRAHVEQRQKLLEVGGTKEPPEMAAEFDARYAELDLTLDILDNEGGDEAE